jgi:hypothetical protein
MSIEKSERLVDKVVNTEDVPVISCPYCGGCYTHILRVGTLLGSDEHEALVYDGTDTTGATGSRRSALEIVFWCEFCQPKLFALVIQQHKGWNFIRIDTDVKDEVPPCGSL